jgi:microcystin-dependent protein
MEISLWSTAPGSNATVGAINWAEGMPTASVNNSARQMMADVADWHHNGAEWIDRGETPIYVGATQFKISGVDVSSVYSVGRRIKLTAPTPVIIYGTISAVSYSSDTTVTMVWDGTTLSNETLTAVALGIIQNASGSQSLDAANIPRINQYGMPAGSIITYGSTAAAPTGFLFCFGQSVSRATYPALFTAISTFYGAGSTTTFSLPDLRGRVLACLDNLGGVAANVLPGATTLGGTGGSTSNTATISVTGTIGATTLSAAQIPTLSYNMPTYGSGTGLGQNAVATGDVGQTLSNTSGLISSNAGGGSHTHSAAAVTATATAVDVIQPYMTLPYIIKT